MSDFRDEITWTAPREGQDWRDENVLAAVEWLTSFVPCEDWARRISATDRHFHDAKSKWSAGHRVPLFEPQDAIAWYVHQALCYANPASRADWFETEGYRTAPVIRRIGQLLPDLKKIVGVEARAARLMIEGKSQPDDGLYELLVGGAYKRRGWDEVAFVPEMPGVAKRPDLTVGRARSQWAVECKRAGRSGYAREERFAGQRMAALAHEIARAQRRPLVVMARFEEELTELPATYLADKVARFVEAREPVEWKDEGGSGGINDIDREPLSRVLRSDDLYFGSSRMIELALGRFLPPVDYSVDGEWLPAPGRPFHATSVDHISVVAWTSWSEEASRRKAKHFRSVIGQATTQLPGDRDGVIHVGYETIGGNSVDGMRHGLNQREMETFDARESRLRGVYGNYFMPEHVTARLESCAVSESMTWYPVQDSNIGEPLPGHLLFSDEDGQPGAHFSR